MSFSFPEIAEVMVKDRDHFRSDVMPAHRPVVMRGLAKEWPAVKAAKDSFEAVEAYFNHFGMKAPVSVSFAPPETQGEFFYSDDMRGYNFVTEKRTLDQILGWLRFNMSAPQTYSVYMQSLPLKTFMPGFLAENPMPLVEGGDGPRLWIGNRLRTQTHFDPLYNIAVLVAGRRRFTLFPPDQAINLYPGPFDTGPGGVPISIASIEAPDFEAYPNFAKALEVAVGTELEPGDAIYIPYGWWHHVRSLEAANILVNYWWKEGPELPTPLAAFMTGLLALRDLPAEQKAIWRNLMDIYVYGDADAVSHIPEHARSVFGPVTPETERRLKRLIKGMLDL